MSKLLKNSVKIILFLLVTNSSIAIYGLTGKADTIQIEVLLNSKFLNTNKIPADIYFINSIDITPKQLILISTNHQFYLIGWELINPVCKPVPENITSFAYTSDNLLMVIRNAELCTFDSTENLTKMINLPRKGMGISAGKYVMYIYDKNKTQTKHSLFVLAQGGKYKKLLDFPYPIHSVCEMHNLILFSSGNGVFSYDAKGNELKALAALPLGNEVKSIEVDTISNRIYFSTDSVVYTIKDSSTIIVTDKIGGALKFFHGGLIVFNPESQLMIRLTNVEGAINSLSMVKKVPENDNIAYDILTNESIIKLVKAELADELIINIINKSHVNFILNVDSMIELANQNVSSAVILAMKNAMKTKASNPK